MRVLLLALASLAFAGGRARAQVCPCNTAQPFGSCPVDVVFPNFPGGPYPDQFPGSVTIVERSGGTVEAYIADYFSGRTHRFSYDTALSSAKYEGSINSPGGSATTTGITARAGEEGTDLFWAVADRLLRSDVDGNNADEVATVNMEELASQLRVDLEDESIPVGRLGDIVYHPVRETFWGVDLTNDVYFEFDESGNLVFEEGEPNYFLNPMRRSAVAGAYGNSITYVRAGDADYFDIPVGALAAGRPTRVMRVHASEGDDHGFGDDTGVFYPIGANLLSVGFPTGIGYWPDYCGDGQHAEILPHVYAANDTLPVVFFTSADEPASASIAAFAAAASGPNEITLSWRKTLPYTSVQFRLQTLDGSGSQPALVGELSDFENDPEMIEIPGVAPGSYEATAVVASGAEAWPPLASRVTVGRGVQVAVARLTPPEDAELSAPGGATALPEGRILVADAAGSAELFDLELSSRGRLPSPAPEGTVTGVAYRAVDDRIYWLQQDGGAAYLHKTDVEGETDGLRLLVDTPANLVQVPTLVGLAYDAAADAFWTVDTLNQVVYAIEADGAVADAFTSAQLPAPDDSLVLGGAIGLSASDATNSVIDLATGTTVIRSSYNRSTLARNGEIFRIDMASTTGAAEVAGIALVEEAGTEFAYIVAQDTQALHKLSIGPATGAGPIFQRGDANDDGGLNISDVSFVLSFLFKQGTAPKCADAADADNTEEIDIGDAIVLFNYLFREGETQVPLGACGVDAEDGLDCMEATSCGA